MGNMWGRVKNTKAISKISNGLNKVESLNSPQDLRNIPTFRKEIWNILGLKPWYFQYLLRKRNNTLTKQDRVRERHYGLSPKNLADMKQNPEYITKVDDFIETFMVLCKRNTREEIATTLNNNELNADKLISWLAA